METPKWKSDPDQYYKCSRCSGTGEVKCPRCAGRGRTHGRISTHVGYNVKTVLGWKQCTACSGSGKWRCSSCKDGSIPRTQPKPPDPAEPTVGVSVTSVVAVKSKDDLAREFLVLRDMAADRLSSGRFAYLFGELVTLRGLTIDSKDAGKRLRAIQDALR